MTEQQKEIQTKLLNNGWRGTACEIDKKKCKKEFSKKGYKVKFDYINTGLIDEYGVYLIHKIRLNKVDLEKIFKI